MTTNAMTTEQHP